MKAAQISEYGKASVVKINEIDTPKPDAGQVMIEVYAASINPFDTSLREGHMKEMVPLQLPVTLGGDIAGVVAQVGAEVSSVRAGDRVYGQANVVAGNSGAFAEFASTKASQVAKAPEGLSFEQAASLPLVGVSALQALKEHINLQPAQKIFINGGSGGIGSIAIQIAKHIGAHVTTTATGEGVDYVKKLGADEVIDYQLQKVEEELSGYDAVFDTVRDDFSKTFKILKKGTVAVTMVAPQPDEARLQAKADELGVEFVIQATKVNTERLSALRELVESGVVTPQVNKVFPLEQISEAFEARENGKVLGKIVLKIKDND